FGDIKIEWIHVNHSIPDCCSLAIYPPQGEIIFHTGDFKCDYHNSFETPIDLQSMRAIGQAGVALLVADSTNAFAKGPSPSEATVREPLASIMTQASGAIFLTTFSSNLWRLNTVFELAKKVGRKVAIFGTGMERTLGFARHLNKLPGEMPELIEMHQVKNMD